MKPHQIRLGPMATLALIVITMATRGVVAAPDPQSASEGKNQIAEVEVTAPKLDPRTLNRVAMKFVELHAAVSPAINQMVRWRAIPCPKVTGLNPTASTFVTHDVERVARSVGAPAARVDGRCAVNIEVVFTPEPQKLLDHIAQAYPVLLGSSQSTGAQVIKHAIQSWYLTGTRSTTGYQPPTPEPGQSDTEVLNRLSDPQVKSTITSIDPDHGTGAQPSGLTGSYFTKGLTSDLLHVLVIVDTTKVAAHSLQSIADYIAMLALTRVDSLDACSDLPSIIDRLASACGARDKPASLTTADSAYLKALYSSDMETNLNLEQGNIRDQMIKTMVGK